MFPNSPRFLALDQRVTRYLSNRVQVAARSLALLNNLSNNNLFNKVEASSLMPLSLSTKEVVTPLSSLSNRYRPPITSFNKTATYHVSVTPYSSRRRSSLSSCLNRRSLLEFSAMPTSTPLNLVSPKASRTPPSSPLNQRELREPSVTSTNSRHDSEALHRLSAAPLKEI